MEPISITKADPMFKLGNFFKPTSRNVLIWATAIKVQCVTAMASSFLMSNAWLFLAGSVVGALCEILIYFTREDPISTIGIAVQDFTAQPVTEQIQSIKEIEHAAE